MDKVRNIALIMAGGCGERMGFDTPKQFMPLGGIPVIVYVLKTFQQHPDVDKIVVVCVPGWESFVNDLAVRYGITKLAHVFSGGESSHDSIRLGVEGLVGLYSGQDIVLVHDSVRPFVSSRIISDNIAVCRNKGNAITAVLDNEALMYSLDGISSEECFPREVMYRAQTPHTFRLETLQKVYAEAEKKGIRSQSLYTLMADLRHYPLYIVKGNRINIKLTIPDDIALFEAILSIKNKSKI